MIPLTKFQHLLKGGRALDLGAGDFQLAKKLQELGYKVDTVDIKDIGPVLNGVKFFRQDILTFDINGYDLIVAKNSLPFTDSRTMIKKIAEGLNNNGITSFTLFGQRDDWNGRAGMTFVDYGEAIRFIKKTSLVIYRQSTEEGYGPTKTGDIKYWHIHSFVCTKPV